MTLLILPQRYQPRVLIPVPSRQWREPSQAQPRDQLGNQNCTRFRLTARLNDGFARWRGWFDSRDDADAFLFALALNIIDGTPVPVEMWRLPSPWWHPDIGPWVSYDFATVVILTTGAGSNQTWTSAVDWYIANNSVEIIAGGGSGACEHVTGPSPQSLTGGGGGEYRKTTNFLVAAPGTTTVTYQCGKGGAAVTSAGAVGNVGGETWWNGTTYAGATLGAVNGGGGTMTHSSTGPGGSAGTGGTGGTGNAGGAGGACSGTSGLAATGGGGAGGPNGAGNNGGGNAAGNGATAGGSGDVGSGGGGGAATGAAGGNGIEWTSAGSGGGGGGAYSANGPGGAGGNYGAGGGGFLSSTSSGLGGSGVGIQGLVVLSYTPFKRGAFFAFF